MGIPDGTPLENLFFTKESGKQFSYVIPESEPDLEALIAANGGRRDLIGPGVLEICKLADVAFLGLHGGMGENGRLQAVLDCFNIPYTGSGYIGCALAMDKALSKNLFVNNNIPTPEWLLFDPAKDSREMVREKIGFP